MLDQNTDRMWFVIGAVIVGAAIIFIANGTIPEIFASVTDSFEGVSNNALAVVDDIEVDDYAGNWQLDSLEQAFRKSAWESGGLNISVGTTGSRIELNYSPYIDNRIRQRDYHEIDHVRRFNMSFNDDLYQLRPTFYSEDYVTISAVWYTESGDVEVPENAKYIRFTAGPHDLNTNGHDSGVDMSDFEQLEIQFTILN